MVQRTYDIDSVLFKDLKTICSVQGITVTHVIQQLIGKYVSDNKHEIFRQSEETKYRLGVPKIHDSNDIWLKFFKHTSKEGFRDIWYRLVYLHSLSQVKFHQEELFPSFDLKLYLQQNPFEDTSDYESLKNLGLSVIGHS